MALWLYRGVFNALDGEVEIDDAYLGAPGKGLAGRGTDRAPFIVAVNRGGGGCAIRAISDCSSGSYLEFGSWHLVRSARIRADGSRSCGCGLAGWQSLDQRVFSEEDADASLPVVHHLISNFKSFVLGTFHGITRKYIQGYMDEFSWRYCHRKDPSAFDSLLAEVISSPKKARSNLVKMFLPQAPQPAAPSKKERSSPSLAIMR